MPQCQVFVLQKSVGACVTAIEDLPAYLKDHYRFKGPKNPFIEPENDNGGPVEYKERLSYKEWQKVVAKSGQMDFRMNEGEKYWGKKSCAYMLGVKDDGAKPGECTGMTYEEAVETFEFLRKIAYRNNAFIIDIDLRQGTRGKYAYVKINKIIKQIDIPRLRVSFFGAKRTGKTTFIKTLLYDEKNTGDFYIKSIDPKFWYLGFDSEGNFVNKQQYCMLKRDKLLKKSKSLLCIIDTPGFYDTKKVLRALMQNFQDVAVFFLSFDQQENGSYLLKETKKQILCAIENNIPYCVVVNKADLVVDFNLKRMQIKQELHQAYGEKAKEMNIFFTSCNEMTNLDQFKYHMHNILLQRRDIRDTNKNMNLEKHVLKNSYKQEFVIHKRYWGSGLGAESRIILGGMCKRGRIIVGESLYVGPDDNGDFHKVLVLSIQKCRIYFQSASAGEYCSIEIQYDHYVQALREARGQLFFTQKDFPKNAVVMAYPKPKPVYGFTAEVKFSYVAADMFKKKKTRLYDSSNAILYSSTLYGVCFDMEFIKGVIYDKKPKINFEDFEDIKLERMTNSDPPKLMKLDQQITKSLELRPSQSEQINDLRLTMTKSMQSNAKKANQLIVIEKDSVFKIRFIVQVNKVNGKKHQKPVIVQKGQQFVINDRRYRARGVIKSVIYDKK